MKVTKFNEKKNRGELMDKCIGLFQDLWVEKLLMIKLGMSPDTSDPNFYQFWCMINRDITQTSYKDFENLFNLLDRLKFTFRFGCGPKGSRLDIYIDNMEAFIEEMETLIDSKKYNL